MIGTLVAVELVTFHTVDGRPVLINPAQITQMIHPHEHGNKMLVETVKCVIRLTDGSYVSIAESCETVQRAVTEGAKQ